MRSLLLTLIPALALSAVPVEKPDTNFKSIHQVQSEQNRPDSSVRPGNPAPVNTAAAAAPVNRTLSMATLLVVVFIILVIVVCVVVIFSFRRKKKSR